MFSGRILILALALIFGLGLATKLFTLDDNKYRCLNGRHFLTDQRFVIFQVGKLQINASPFGCKPEDRYSTSELKPSETVPINP